MSVSSLGLLTPSAIHNSEISLICHSETSNSSVDSLICSTDSLNCDDKARQYEDPTMNDVRDFAEITDSISEHNTQIGMKESAKEPNQTLKKTKSVQKADENGNNHECNNIDKDMANKCEIYDANSSPKKSKIPKSRTFDSAAATSGSSSNRNVRSKMATQKNGTGSKNHVFMTSQECMVVPGNSKLPRQTIASRLRCEKQGTSQGYITPEGSDGSNGEGYHTPSQRKDLLLRDLRRQVREAKTVCEEKDREIAMYKQHVDEETSKLVSAKDEEITQLREELRKLKQSYDDISSFCEESISAASALEQKAQNLKVAMDDREKEHQKIYLEMYKKGQHSARFEREEELERLASAGGCKVTISELVKKLAWTELELAKWQTLRREESYHDTLPPETESYTTLRFLKDAFFHYITDERESDHHLRAMIKIFKYTEPQMAKIRESRLIEAFEKRNRKRLKNVKHCQK